MESIINLKDYTVIQHVFFALGCLLWVFTYVLVIKNLRSHKFIEIPLVAVAANFSWEFLWSFVFTTDMGLLYVWGYRIWFFLDCFIVWGLFKYVSKQVAIAELKPYSRQILAFCILSFMAILYYYIKIYDYPISHNGVYSGYILNVFMSALYIPLMLRLRNTEPFNITAAWLKGVGTLLITIFCFIKYDDGFLLSMCIVTTILDVLYIYFIHSKNKTR
jgi:hypothetical protein